MFITLKVKGVTYFRWPLVTLFFFTVLQFQAQAEQQQPEWIYYTLKDDTIWNLCLKYTNKRGCWISLAEYNQVENTRQLTVNTPIRIPASWLKTPLAVGDVVYVTGKAEYSQKGDQQYKQLTSGQKVHLGGKVRTPSGSVVKLLLHETNYVLIGENSELLLERFSSADEPVLQQEISLKKGGTKAEVNSGKVENRFIIKTPAAIAAVRGTAFRINSSGEQMRGEVLEGSIDVSSDISTQSVTSGYGVVATKGKEVPVPKVLLPKPALPAGPIISTLPATVSWDKMDQISRYQASLSNEKGEIIRVKKLEQNSVSYNALDLGCYQLNVRAIDAEGLQGLDNQVPLCIVDELVQVVLSEEMGLVAKGENVMLSWQAVAGADGYIVQMATDEGFTHIVEELTPSEAQAVFTKLKNQTLYFRVMATDNHGRVGLPSNVLDYTDRSLLKSILGAAFLIGLSFL